MLATDPRAILHVDMDAFYASVEQRDRPELRGRPVLVAHDGPRGVVSAASYESRTFGCRSAMPTARARRLCPQAVVVEPRMEHYVAVSEQVFAIFESLTPLVEPLSIDEAFLDVTGSTRLFGPPLAIAALIKQRVHDETRLTASVGVAPNKFLAKLCSEWEKPDGLVALEPGAVLARLSPLPIRRMWGVGPVTEQRLLRAGFASFGDLQRVPLEACCARLGPHGEWFWRLARGEDERPVVPDAEAKSLGAEQTFGEDVAEPESVRQVLLAQMERVAARLRRHALAGRTVTVKIRYGDFETITRSETLDAATDRSDLLRATASTLFERWARRDYRPVRLIGGSASQLVGTDAGQGALFGDPADERARRLDRATDAIRAKYGADVIRRGVGDVGERRKSGLDS
ncbi:MAG TPA: DNA polymerase IV [Planctomycetota bacterium]|nr:DNA polymerase IV [Planctomycetota bacterium]